MLRTSMLDYELPPERIATVPASPRDSARMLVVSRSDAARYEDAHVRDLPDRLRPGDVIVVNTSRVVPAYLAGRRMETGGKVTGLFLRGQQGRFSGDAKRYVDAGEVGDHAGRHWIVMLKGGHLHAGVRLMLERATGEASGVVVRLESRVDDEPGAWRVEVEAPRELRGATDAMLLEAVGATPIPPYIRAARKAASMEIQDARDRVSYQTVYAHEDQDGPDAGSVAAPTAGLHFTPELLASLEAHGVERAEVSLHVGAGTFKPIETEYVEQHPIHAEWCFVPRAAWEKIKAAKARGGRVVCIGTTAVRTVESFAANMLAASDRSARKSAVEAGDWFSTRLLITPGFQWRVTDAMLTNFHLPRSSLMALVAAFMAGGIDQLQGLYRRAVMGGYRFYSYGDAMLVLP